MSEMMLPVWERIVVRRENDTVSLMQLTVADAQLYYDLIAFDPDHLRQHGDQTADKYPDAASVEQSIAQPANPNRYRFGIWDGDIMVGTSNLTLTGEGKAEVGTWVGKQYTGHGYAGRGCGLLADFAFKTLGLSEVHCDIAVGNDASRRTAEKIGFVFAGESAAKGGERTWHYVLRKGDATR